MSTVGGKPGLEFHFLGYAVGLLLADDPPRLTGQYRYMPYRSGGHFFMHVRLRSRGKAKCSYETNDEIVKFTVSSCPEYGILELCDFEINPRPAS